MPTRNNLYAGFSLFFVLLIPNQNALANWRCAKTLTSTHPIEREWVTEDQLKTNLATLRQQAGADAEKNGFFGPGSMMWEVSKVPFLALFAETELYMQLAHPAGAQGVFDHSRRLQEDPLNRFRSTFDFIWRMTYGSASEAEALSLTLHKIHTRITGVMKHSAGRYQAGEEYRANEADALLWIHATHWYSVMKTYEVFVRKLSLEERDAFIADSKKFGMMLGIPEFLIPSTWQEFGDYFRYMRTSGELEYTPDAKTLEAHFRKMSAQIEHKNPLLWGIRQYSDMITASTLPENLAAEFGLKKSLPKKAAYFAALKALRLIYKQLPESLRTLPMYYIAQARAEGRPVNPWYKLAHKTLIGK
jgi:uncharacterized protein (DUF2236 family)